MSANHIEDVLQQTLGNLHPLFRTVMVLVVLTLVSFGGSYFGVYYAERGQAYATDQRFDTILEQLKQTTQTAE
jgi:hypothetical protein